MNREDKLNQLVKALNSWGAIQPTSLCEGGWLFMDIYSHPDEGVITIDDWNRAKIVPNTFVKVLSQEHRDLISSYLITLGGRYHGNSKADCIKSEPYLHFEEGCEGYYVDAVSLRSAHHAYKEIFIELPEDKNTVKLSGAEKVNTRNLSEMEMLLNHPKANNAIANARVLAEKVGAKHSHYFKDVSNLDTIDVYRICDLCEIDDNSGATQHAVKKLLCAGQRGAKDKRKDLEEARDTIIRKLAMMSEDEE